MPKVAANAETLERMNKKWKEVLATEDSDRSIIYCRTAGEQFTTSLWVIARHVVNHGTYHRGELRGLCRARGEIDFPETDFSLFAQAK